MTQAQPYTLPSPQASPQERAATLREHILRTMCGYTSGECVDALVAVLGMFHNKGSLDTRRAENVVIV